jgi:hypothetical protein
MAYRAMLDCGCSDRQAIFIIDQLIAVEVLGQWAGTPVEAGPFQGVIDEDDDEVQPWR